MPTGKLTTSGRCKAGEVAKGNRRDGMDKEGRLTVERGCTYCHKLSSMQGSPLWTSVPRKWPRDQAMPLVSSAWLK